ncbi:MULTISPECIES: DEAD/DEAH box helicase [unclassified Pseudomonas]|uniref:DEAD/DEAH box helicase n=1 Tax=unclassified Pseudomonas TaxID=196821 RepID=UPI0002A423C0|nr:MULTISPECIES: DEAD/DEAH box helicase [unclassified Pseudomonas]MBB1610231.1 DEAD/DEAH box helicase [Pseudomonas sp. UMC76]MBB1639894.1 DEAD/DEAH box helicase [Pseudomonas sp. UME83]NTX90723.1 DEAD/DEAH box helicase [Pseudomonas sp. UMA643]NTY17232.1 DEAD/DEAH box helicase [Pseudomonas sp. UMC3103]NTY26685.1 DEAD/DEAH box helicase [Pseudomonas sp. UMA603]
MSFSSLGLSEALARAVEAAGYSQPTPVQERAIPAVLQGRDLMVAAQTGTGKTGGFALPVLERLFPEGHPDREHRHGPRQARVLVLTPTRELAAQVHDSFKVYARDLPLKSACIFGGVGMNPQVQAMSKGVDVLVACPGRLLDLIGQGSVDLSRVEILVLDEADRMLDMGFIHDVKKVLAKLPPKRQNLLFSATFSKDITDLANKLLHNPERIEVTPPNTTVERIEQRVFRIPSAQKRALLAHLVTVGAWEQVLVFTRTKHGANRLAEYLSKHGLPAAAIHGNKSQNARTKALADFKTNDVRILVATDIAARGLDIDQLPHVVNYELPNVEEDYVHRIGRTGRAGRSGEAISLVAPDEEKLLKAIERLTRQQIPAGDTQGFDPEAVLPEVALPEPKEQPQRQPRKDKAKRERKPRDKEPQQAQPAAEAAHADAGAEQGDKPAGKRRRRGGRGKKKGEAQGDQQPGQQAQRGDGQAKQPRPPKPAAQNDDRDPEEFLDDDYDNFGNRADYVSPFPDKDVQRGQRRRGGQPQGQASQGQRARGQGQAQGQGQGQKQGKPGQKGTGQGGQGPRGKNANGQARGGQGGNAQGKQRAARKRGGKGQPSLMSDAPLREPSEYGAAKPTRQPVVINKRDLVRGDRFPTAEQLEELEPRREKGERPALLTRNR